MAEIFVASLKSLTRTAIVIDREEYLALEEAKLNLKQANELNLPRGH